jgi:phosphoribosyl-ATP pyrophosphohydrolase/phosphoribosyl-AMP cyclohydrolase
MINFEKGNGLVPVIIQDETTLQVLMLGFMNEEALKLTEETGKVHFFSRTKDRIWLKANLLKIIYM